MASKFKQENLNFCNKWVIYSFSVSSRSIITSYVSLIKRENKILQFHSSRIVFLGKISKFFYQKKYFIFVWFFLGRSRIRLGPVSFSATEIANLSQIFSVNFLVSDCETILKSNFKDLSNFWLIGVVWKRSMLRITTYFYRSSVNMDNIVNKQQEKTHFCRFAMNR